MFISAAIATLLLLAALAFVYFKLSAQIKERRTELLRSQDVLYRQSEALLYLYSELRPAYGLPVMRGWAASPDFLREVCETFAVRRPRLIVECSSGVSTLALAYMAKRSGHGRIVSLEHDPAYAEKTLALLRRHGVDDVVEVHVAPLVDLTLPGWSGQWYDLHRLQLDSTIDMLVVDGPPAFMQLLARLPAYPVLRSYLSDDAFILLDDASREDEDEAIRRWCQGDPDLHLVKNDAAFEKGCAVLQRRRSVVR